jgi:hypothetical protein
MIECKIRKSYHIPTGYGAELTVTENGDSVILRFSGDPPFMMKQESWRGLMSLNYDIRFDDPEASDE